MGCVMQVGEQSTNIARNAVLASKLPESVPGTSVDRQCGSSQQALHFAAQAVMSGTMDIVIAAGVESMTRVPMGLSSLCRPRTASAPTRARASRERYPNIEFSQFIGAEMIAEKYGLTKDQLDEYRYDSHQRAIAATQAGAFKDEIVPLQITDADGATETPRDRRGHPLRRQPRRHARRQAAAEGGRLTAATASQICDGASGVMVVSERGLKALGVTPLARIHHLTLLGHDPVIMLEAPMPATERALKKAGMSIDDIDLFEVNEAFASVPLAWLQTTGRRPGAAERQRRRHRARPSARRLGHQADDHAGPRAEAAQQALRPADHVRRRRHGQRDDRRAAVGALQ